MKGFIFAHQKSFLDPTQDVVGIITLESKNVKTGNIAQAWILPANVPNMWDVMRKGSNNTAADAICGCCPHRRDRNGACYVMPQGVEAVHRSYRAGKYPDLSKGGLHRAVPFLAGRVLRMGAYGDPAAIDAKIWQALKAVTSGHTGYTHQMDHPNIKGTEQASEIAKLCMISCETVKQAEKWQSRGCKTFRIMPAGVDNTMASEIPCPADPEKGLTCLTCNNRCDTRNKSVTVPVHGTLSHEFNKRYNK